MMKRVYKATLLIVMLGVCVLELSGCANLERYIPLQKQQKTVHEYTAINRADRPRTSSLSHFVITPSKAKLQTAEDHVRYDVGASKDEIRPYPYCWQVVDNESPDKTLRIACLSPDEYTDFQVMYPSDEHGYMLRMAN